MFVFKPRGKGICVSLDHLCSHETCGSMDKDNKKQNVGRL